MQFTLESLLSATNGELLTGNSQSECNGASIDSRNVASRALFVPIKADRDGHDYIANALSAGAAGFLTSSRQAIPDETVASTAIGEFFAIGVDDTSEALVNIGRMARQRFNTVVCVTGSNGKTTTKDFLSHILAGRWTVGRTEQSFNNELGIPLTLVNAPDAAEVLVAEIGARKKGDVAWGTDILKPHIGVVTNVHHAHVGEFGSQEGIAKTKSELPAALPADGFAILNGDDPLVDAMASVTDAQILRFGFGDNADIRATDLTIDANLTAHFTLVTPRGKVQCQVDAAGEHTVCCALAAAAASYALDCDLDLISNQLASAPRSTGRMEIINTTGDWRILNDAYNANLDSMRAGLKSGAHMARQATPPGRAFAILGHMAELGDTTEEAHIAAGEAAKALGYEAVVAVGPYAELISSHVAGDVNEAVSMLQAMSGGLNERDVVVLKASKMMKLWEAAPLLLVANKAEPVDLEL